jgi:23S rRNA (adenine2030-N6)-methyltransferase
MNYRHAYHAGNFADVHKHMALVAILLHLRKKDKPFAIIDTHAGGGLYDLAGPEAAKTNESGDGIAKLRGVPMQTPALRHYLEIVDGFGPDRYPGSPLIAAQLLRERDRLIAIEKHPEEFESLRRALTSFRNAHAVCGDGYRQLNALLPPAERRGLILLDPSYEDAGETEALASAFANAYRRFPTGIFLIWHPLKMKSKIETFAGELRSAARLKLLSLTIDVDQADSSGDRLSASGVLVVNPPHALDLEMEAASAEILPPLARGAGASATVRWISPPR